MFRNSKAAIAPLIQASTIGISLFLAWFLRFDFTLSHPRLLFTAIPLLILIRWSVLFSFKLTHTHWRYTGIGDLQDLVKAVVIGSIFFFLAVRVVGNVRAFPYSVYILEGILTFLLLSGLRVVSRMVLAYRAVVRVGAPVPVLIVGAGSAASLLLDALQRKNCKVVGMVDDDPAKQRMKVGGKPVLGTVEDLPMLVQRHNISEILIAMPSATGQQMLRVTEYCLRSEKPFRAVPSLASLIDGTGTISELRELDLDDLLGREPVRLDATGVRHGIQDRVVMVTGAAGSIGSELCRQIVRCNPSKLICVDQSETPLFNLQAKLNAESTTDIVYSVADITDTDRMCELIQDHRVKAIFHAAAYKHVPMTEDNPYEALKNNVFGLLEFVEAAEECNCEDFLLISSDKAVNPSSLMGCTKRIGEMIVGSRASRMRCVSVRFGNVLGSQGSVVPTFQEQIRTGNALTVTHPEMTRYFMTIPEAVSLTLQASIIGRHGEILVLDMGNPVRILDLAETLIRISGKKLADVPIIFTGVRPGEKLFEELFYDSEVKLPTSLSKIVRAQSNLPQWPVLERQLDELKRTFRSRGPKTHDLVRLKIKEMIPEYMWEPAYLEALAADGFFNPNMGLDEASPALNGSSGHL